MASDKDTPTTDAHKAPTAEVETAHDTDAPAASAGEAMMAETEEPAGLAGLAAVEAKLAAKRDPETPSWAANAKPDYEYRDRAAESGGVAGNRVDTETVDQEIKAWVRREIELALQGHGPQLRDEMNP